MLQNRKVLFGNFLRKQLAKLGNHMTFGRSSTNQKIEDTILKETTYMKNEFRGMTSRLAITLRVICIWDIEENMLSLSE